MVQNLSSGNVIMLFSILLHTEPKRSLNIHTPCNFHYDVYLLQPFLKQQILDSSKHKEFADDNFKFDGNGRKLSIRVDNTVDKGEIACY